MKLIYTSAAMTIAALTVGVTALASARQTAPGTKHGDDQAPITLVGCIQKEAEYRHATGSGTGGVGGFGVGLGDEYILIKAMRRGVSPSSNAPQGSTVNDIAAAESPCGGSNGGEAFELTGSRERELDRFVGRRVEIVGVLKPGTDAPVGTSGTETRTDTTGLNKLNPFDQDLHLQEVEITSFRESKR